MVVLTIVNRAVCVNGIDTVSLRFGVSSTLVLAVFVFPLSVGWLAVLVAGLSLLPPCNTISL